MGKLTRDDVIKLGRLSRLDLSEEEVTEFAEELSTILQYVEQLQAVDLEGLKPTNQVTGLTNIYRPDIVEDYGYKPTELLNNVPFQQDGLIKVKRMVG